MGVFQFEDLFQIMGLSFIQFFLDVLEFRLSLALGELRFLECLFMFPKFTLIFSFFVFNTIFDRF